MLWTAPQVTEVDEPFAGDERTMLEGFLDRNRRSLLRKCAGLTGAQLAERACPPSNLSLLGLVRHATEVERTWFRRRFAGQDLEQLYASEQSPDAAFEEADGEYAEHDLVRLVAEQEAARRAVAGLPLDATYISPRWGRMELRWCLLHMYGEYAQHNGHADLLRERIDGAVGL